MTNIIDISQLTSKQLKEMKSKQLDEIFKTTFPNGKFTLHIRELNKYNDFYRLPQREVELSCEKRRGTSWSRYKAIVVSQYGTNEIIKTDFVNNSFGLTKHFNGIEELLKSAKRYKVSQELIDTFIKEYNEKNI